MNITYTEDSLDGILDMICECGHKLSEHAFTALYSLNILLVSQCVMCECKEFRVQDE